MIRSWLSIAFLAVLVLTARPAAAQPVSLGRAFNGFLLQNGLAADAQGNWYVVTQLSPPVAREIRFQVHKLSPEGALLWTVTPSLDARTTLAQALTVTPQGQLYIA